MTDREKMRRAPRTHFDTGGAALCAMDWKIGASKLRLTRNRAAVDCGICKLMLGGKVWRGNRPAQPATRNPQPGS